MRAPLITEEGIAVSRTERTDALCSLASCWTDGRRNSSLRVVRSLSLLGCSHYTSREGYSGEDAEVHHGEAGMSLRGVDT